MKTALHSLGRSFLDLIYPPLCLHCKTIIVSGDARVLCPDCLRLLELIDPAERCPLCFSANYSMESKRCFECSAGSHYLNGVAAAFDYLGPAESLIRKLKYSNLPYLAEGCGGYMAAQFLQLEWPMPDFIIPVPISFTRWMTRGYNQSMLLAESIGKILQCPIKDAIKRRSGGYSQAGLSRQQRITLDGSLFQLKPEQGLQDRSILLIDDVMTTGSTLQRCTEAILSECPAKIYALTFARAM